MHPPAVNLRIYQPPRREIDEIEDSRVKAVTVQGGNLLPHEPHTARGKSRPVMNTWLP